MSPAFEIVDVPQRSPEWFQARCAILTGTCASAMLAKIKSGEAAARRDLRLRLVTERLTGMPQEDGYQSPDMKRGIELEPEAFAAYEAATGIMAYQVGFVRHRILPVGCSPDGIIGSSDQIDGVIELKVPRSATHLGYWRAGVLPSEHAPQVTHALFVTAAPFCDFVSFDPRFPPSMQLFRVRVRREDANLKAYELALTLFLSEVEHEYEEVAKLAAETVGA